MNERRRTADLITQEEESLLLCPNPYTCGDHSLDDRPPEVLLKKLPRMKFFPEEPSEFAGKVVVHMSCCSCNKLAVRWTDAMIKNSRKAIRVTINPHRMNIVPGVTVVREKINDDGHHPNLFGDLLLYAKQKFGVGSLDQILLTRKLEDTPPNLKFDVIIQCSHCGNRREGSNNNLLKCGGICGGKARYCNASCQKSHRSIHKHECWRKADTDTFTIPYPNNGEEGESLPPIKVKAYHQLDGYNRSGINLTYAESYPMNPMEPDGDQYPKDMTWTYATTPIDDESGGRSLKYGEAVFNTTKHPVEVNALLEMGIIKDTGKKLDLNYYKQHPICRINLPIYRDNEYTDNDDDDNE
jgi:hypothetical protein